MEQAFLMRAPTAEPPAQHVIGAERRVINRRGISLEPFELASSPPASSPMPRSVPSKLKRPGSASPSLISQPNMEIDAAKLSENTRDPGGSSESWASRSKVE